MFQKSKRKKQVLLVLILLWTVFIWGNSLLPGQESSQVSGFVSELIAVLFGPWVQEATFLIRKLAHFTEFAVLGFLLSWRGRLEEHCARSLPILAGTIAAMTDEGIQNFVPGRCAAVTDVWIDFFGVLTGTSILLIIHHRKQ